MTLGSMLSAFGFAFAAATLALPASAGTPLVEILNDQKCEINGVVVQFAPVGNNALGCENCTQEGCEPAECEVNGVVIQGTVTGTNRFCTEGGCEINGIYAAVGETDSCAGSGLIVACVSEDVCVALLDLHGPSPQ